MITAWENLEAGGFEPLYFDTVGSITGFQGLLDMAKSSDAVSIFLYTHGDAKNIYLGDGKPDDFNTITMKNLLTLVNRSSSLVDIRIYGCNAGALDGGIAAALAKQLNVTVYAATGGMIFSNNPNTSSSLKTHPNTGPTYLVHNGGQWRAFNPK